MLKQRAREVKLIVASLDLLLMILAFLSAYHLRAYILPRFFDGFQYVPLGSHPWILVVSLPLFHMLFRFFRLYESIRTASFAQITISVAKPFLIAMPVLGSLVYLAHDQRHSRVVFVGFLGLYFVMIVAEKWLIKGLQNQVRRHGYNTRDILMVGAGPQAARLAKVLEGQSHLGMRVIGHLSLAGEPPDPGVRAPILGMVEDLPKVLDHQVVDEVFFAAPASTLLSLEPYIWKCEEIGIRVHIKADFINTLLSRTYTSDVDGIPILTFSSAPHTPGLILVKRMMDIALSSIALAVLAPLMLVIAVAIKLNSRGPILHRQVRSGLNGRRFVLLKFRSMHETAEREQPSLAGRNEASGPVFKMRNDPRVTAVGRHLRRLSLDEIPQLWNVLKGDMSLVGPRPPIPREVEGYRRWQRRRLSMKPGLTCLWQVNGRSKLDFDTWMRLDMEYIDNWSLSLDLRILLRTIPVVMFARGAH